MAPGVRTLAFCLSCLSRSDDLVIVVTNHHVVALVLARIEVLRGAAVVGSEHAAVVPVGAREEPPVATFAEQRVPHAADLRGIDSGAAPGGAADAVDVSDSAAEVVASNGVFTAGVRCAMARLRFQAERHSWARRC